MNPTVSVQINGITDLNTDFGKNVIDHTLQMWITPEIEKRKQTKMLPDNFQLLAAQVIMQVDAPGLSPKY